jgi:5-methylcytosine-specific restriction endonuclease McrA
VGRTSRVVPGWMRRALVVRDKWCVMCGRPAAWCDSHHIVAWEDGGETKLSNLALVCRRCHRLLHEGGWRLVRTADGVMVALPP